MSIAGNRVMGTPFFHELKKQASFFFKEKIRNARLALTDVTPAELVTEDATNGNPWAPDARTMGFVSRAAFEIDDYWRIVEILHKRFLKFDRTQWREPYHALILLEHLLTHGPESIAEEFQCDKEVIGELGTFQFIDERGFNWGLAVRRKSEGILKLLEKGPLLKEERDRARKLTRGIEGFGSFNQRWSSSNESSIEHASDSYGRCNSHYEDYSGRRDLNYDTEFDGQLGKKSMEGSTSDESLRDGLEAGINDEPTESPADESQSLLACDEERPKIEYQKEEQHPFRKIEHQGMESVLLLSQG